MSKPEREALHAGFPDLTAARAPRLAARQSHGPSTRLLILWAALGGAGSADAEAAGPPERTSDLTGPQPRSRRKRMFTACARQQWGRASLVPQLDLPAGRIGAEVFASGLETLKGASSRSNNCRWLLYPARGPTAGSRLKPTPLARTPGTVPLAGFPDGPLFLSANPTRTTNPEAYSGPAPAGRVLAFEAGSNQRLPTGPSCRPGVELPSSRNILPQLCRPRARIAS